ncbi:MAG: HNH endonuclease [Gemmataceae bacterium]|nr:HNH endonuclease [Gemmataceae bacterium]
MDFSPYAVRELRVRGLTGDHAKDRGIMMRHIARVNGWYTRDGRPATGRVEAWLRKEKLDMHHAAGTKVLLVPSKLHGGIPHTGSASDLRSKRK